MFYTNFEHPLFYRYINRSNSVGTLFYIHGLGESGFCFESLMQNEFLFQWSHIAVDLEGYGKSLWPETPTSLEHHADRVAQWLHTQDINQVILVGHSMGGVIGLILAEKYPECVKGFINIEGNISIEDCTLSRQAAAYSLEDFQTQGFAAMRDSIYSQGLTDPAFRGYYPSFCFCQPQTYHLNSCELVKVSESAQLAARLSSLPIPLIYLLGNPRGTAELSRSMLSSVGVEWRAIHAAGHWPFIDQPERFVDEMRNFLQQFDS